jgi:hypothetical protein
MRFTTLSPAVGGKHTATDLLRFYFSVAVRLVKTKLFRQNYQKGVIAF